MTVRDEFIARLDAACADRLIGVDRAILDALKDGEADDLPALRADRRRLRDMPASIQGETLEELLPQWPADFPALPEWIVDPAAAAAKDPPGEPCVVVCNPLPPVELEESDAGESLVIPADLETQILATRAAKSIEEDSRRAAGTEDGRQARAEDLGL